MGTGKSHDLPSEALQVLEFWFSELEPEQWWTQDNAVDASIKDQFSALYEKLVDEVPQVWLESALGRLAVIIVLDQFPRNLFRDDPRSYGSDEKALALAEETIALGLDQKLDVNQRGFLYMPFQHSEDLGVQERSCELFATLGNESSLDFARKHRDIIKTFGRFPHRNVILGRQSTPEEVEFLKGPALFW